MRHIEIYDTTLRDGSQAEEISFSVEDKLRITEKLDELGIHYIEGGWPGSNPRDMDYFRKARKLRLTHSKVVAFGSTHKPGITVQEDANLKALVFINRLSDYLFQLARFLNKSLKVSETPWQK